MRVFFLESRSGPLFATYRPASNPGSRRAILHVPAFAEEMNKSRRMVALQADALAGQGYAVLSIDLFGTGDSAGDFVDASWRIWQDNLLEALDWLVGQGAERITLWSLRAGTLLALDLIKSGGCKALDSLIAWQPVLNGEVFLTQFLRLRVAAAMMNPELPQETTGELKKQLQRGEVIEVAGYSLNPELVLPLLAAKADLNGVASIQSVALIEVLPSGVNELSAQAQQFVRKLQDVAINTAGNSVAGDSFWSSQDIVTVPDLIPLTISVLVDLG